MRQEPTALAILRIPQPQLVTHLTEDKPHLDQPWGAQHPELPPAKSRTLPTGHVQISKKLTKLVKREIFNLVFPFYTKSVIQVTNCIYSQIAIKQSKVYIYLYTDLINKFYWTRELVPQQFKQHD